MRICVVGAGAIGGVLAAGLAAGGGADVSVLARGATLAALRTRGLRLTSVAGHRSPGAGRFPPGETVTVQVAAAADAAELGRQDFVVVAVKAQSMAGVAASLRPLLGPDTAVLSTLNGVPWWFLDGFGGPAAGRHLDSVDPGGFIASVLPAARVIGGTVHLSASSPAPGEVSWRSGNGLIIGEPDGSGSARSQALAGALRAGRLRGDAVLSHPRGRLVQAVGQPDGQPDLRAHQRLDRAGDGRRPGARADLGGDAERRGRSGSGSAARSRRPPRTGTR